MTKSLVEGILDWLEQGGYPLELYVAKTLREHGYICVKSPFYSDVESEKPREIDLVAIKYSDTKSHLSLSTTLIIECKKSTSAFVVLCDEPITDALSDSLLKNAIFNNLDLNGRDGMFVLMSFAPLIDARDFNFADHFPTPLLNTSCRRGYTILQAHQKGDSSVYAEIYKLVKACHAVAQKDISFREEILKADEGADNKNWGNTFFLNIPVLVVDAPLVEVYLNDAGEAIVEEKEVSTVKVLLPWQPDNEQGLTIAVVTKTRIADFAKDVITFTNEIVKRSAVKT